MANPEHVEILKQGVEVWNKWREENPDVVPDLKGVCLYEEDLKRANLFYADLTDADLQRTNLRFANLSRANLKGANLNGASLFSADLVEADLRGALLKETNLLSSRLIAANLSNSNLSKADFSGANLMAANLKNANLENTLLKGTTLLETNLSYAKLHGIRLWGTAKEDWIIKNVQCSHIYDDDFDEIRVPKNRDFEEGEFESLYASLPSFEYIFENGMQPLDPVFMNQVAENIKTKNPEFELEIDSITARGLKPSIKFVVKHEHKESAEQAVIENYEKTIARLEGGKEELQKMLGKYMSNNSVQISGGSFPGANFGSNQGTQSWNLTQIDNSNKLDEDTKVWLKSVAGKLQDANLDEADQNIAQAKLEAFQSEIEKDQKDESKIKKTWDMLVALAPDIQKLSTLPDSINKVLGGILG